MFGPNEAFRVNRKLPLQATKIIRDAGDTQRHLNRHKRQRWNGQTNRREFLSSRSSVWRPQIRRFRIHATDYPYSHRGHSKKNSKTILTNFQADLTSLYQPYRTNNADVKNTDFLLTDSLGQLKGVHYFELIVLLFNSVIYVSLLLFMYSYCMFMYFYWYMHCKVHHCVCVCVCVVCVCVCKYSVSAAGFNSVIYVSLFLYLCILIV